jgi:23S rRNA (cytosine1962-C5)-methyltransferase
VRPSPQTLAAALGRRRPLEGQPRTTCFRLLNAEGDGVPGVTLDLFGEVGLLSFYEALSPEEESTWVAALLEALHEERERAPLRALYLKRRPREARVVANTEKDRLAPELPAWGERVPELVVKENGLSFLIRPAQGLSVGLYLDMRDVRAWVQRAARGKTVLNCFSYTCAFGVAATAGGAARVLNLDLSRRVLDWGEENARLNGQGVSRRDFLAGDVFDWLGRLARKGEAFDLVILDPPSFAKGRSGVFSAAKDYASLAALGAAVTAKGGTLLACCNQESWSQEKFEAACRTGISGAERPLLKLERLGASDVDFPGSALKVFALGLG